ncbi:MAG: efflux RND transporter periplasmic adaptor subunit [Proteobacteria bacterium]|jgi:multidrug efflux pump subunit AcrA (membrane-fusion protein)|nr:efflux RND transporter periplasmic adaptor subunit [Pseudomonadota bacterium]
MILHLSKKKLGIVVCLIVVLGGGLSWLYYSNQQKKSQWIPVGRQNITEAVYGVGTVVSDKIFEHRQAIVATIRDIKVKEGDQVQRGQPLVVFDEGQVIRSAIDGVVTFLPYHILETVTPQSVVIRVQDLTHRHIEVGLEQRGAIRVRAGQTVRLSFENLRTEKYLGVVESLYPSQNQFTVRVTLKDQIPTTLLPGMTADVSIEVSEVKSALTIPIAAVTSGKVIKKVNGRKEKISLELGLQNGSEVQVVRGDLNEGDLIFVPSQR